MNFVSFNVSISSRKKTYNHLGRKANNTPGQILQGERGLEKLFKSTGLSIN